MRHDQPVHNRLFLVDFVNGPETIRTSDLVLIRDAL
jgi:hypothetical protein